MTTLFGSERGAKVLHALTHVKWNALGEAHRPGERTTQPAHAVFWSTPQASAQDESTRVALAHMLKAYERTSTSNRRACSSALYRGRTHRFVNEGTPEQPVWRPRYIRTRGRPGAAAGGRLTSSLKRCTRTLDRHVQVFEAAGLVNVYQPPAADVPADMKGAQYAYAVWEWREEVPREIARAIESFWGHRGRDAAARRSREHVRAHPDAAPVTETSRGAPLALAPELAAALARLADVIDGPPR